MMIFDAHLDMAWNACDWNRNLLLPVAEIRKSIEQLLIVELPEVHRTARRGKAVSLP